jgi:hypothetical protein
MEMVHANIVKMVLDGQRCVVEHALSVLRDVIRHVLFHPLEASRAMLIMQMSYTVERYWR